MVHLAKNSRMRNPLVPKNDFHTLTKTERKQRTVENHAILRNFLSYVDLVPPFAGPGEVPKIPVSPSNEGPVWGQSVRAPAVGVIFTDISWISWFSNWITFKICSFRVSRFAISFLDQFKGNPVVVCLDLFGLRLLGCVNNVFFAYGHFRMHILILSFGSSETFTAMRKAHKSYEDLNLWVGSNIRDLTMLDLGNYC